MKNQKIDSLDTLIDAFVKKGITKAKFNNYEIDGNHLVYRAFIESETYIDNADRMINLIKLVEAKRIVLVHPKLEKLNETVKGDYFYKQYVKVKSLKQDVIASRLDNDGKPFILGNSSVLPLIGRTNRWGRVNENRQETEIQAKLALLIPMLPFTVFEQAKLDFRSIRIVDKGNEEKVTRKNPNPLRIDYEKGQIVPEIEFETVHFTGASLFEIDNKQFLFDIDRRELKHKIFNPFLVKLPNKVSSIKEAYESLMPSEVKEAVKSGIKVLRQGEWFFIQTNELTSKRLENLNEVVKQITLRAGPNRPNYTKGIQMYQGKPVNDQRGLRDYEEIDNARQIVSDSEFFVTGKVEHAGREHATLNLKGWFKAIPNTATESFTITGDID